MQELSSKPVNIKSSGQASSNAVKIKKNPPSKKRRHISVAGVFCILLILIFAGSIAAVYFDVAGAKQIASSLLQLNTTPTSASDTQKSAAQSDLELQAANIAKDREALNARQQDISTKESELNTREADLTKREEAVTAAENQLKTDKQNEKNLADSAKIFEQMDAAKAAKAIAGMATTAEMAQVLMHMDSAKAALIMNQMKPALATQILSEMVK